MVTTTALSLSTPCQALKDLLSTRVKLIMTGQDT